MEQVQALKLDRVSNIESKSETKGCDLCYTPNFVSAEFLEVNRSYADSMTQKTLSNHFGE